MKTLARLITVCAAAQLLFVGVLNAKVSSSTTPNSTICAMPDGDYDPVEGFLAPDGDYDPVEGFLAPDGDYDPVEGF